MGQGGIVLIQFAEGKAQLGGDIGIGGISLAGGSQLCQHAAGNLLSRLFFAGFAQHQHRTQQVLHR